MSQDLTANQPGKFSLGPKEQEARLAHREWIGGRIYTLLSHYWREDDEDMLSAAIAADWADVLEGLPREAIQKACIRYQREEPRRKPTPGAIYAMARDAMPTPTVAYSQPIAPAEKPGPTEEERARIAEYVRKAGFAPKRFGGGE